jgi:predicted MPP superfamily phosphohydrolase
MLRVGHPRSFRFGQHALTSAATPIRHPQSRKLVFLGDLVDRGPKIPQVLKLMMNADASGAALCVPGNHDVKQKSSYTFTRLIRKNCEDTD